MYKKVIVLVIITILIFILQGCDLLNNTPLQKTLNNPFLNKISEKIKMYFDPTPKSPEDLADKFIKAVKKKDIKKLCVYFNTKNYEYVETQAGQCFGKDFKISFKDSNGLIIIENVKDGKEKYGLTIRNDNNKYFILNMGPYDPNVPSPIE